MCNQRYGDILDFKQAHNYLKVSPRKLRYMIKSGEVRPGRVPTENGNPANGKLIFYRTELHNIAKSWRPDKGQAK